MGKRAVLLIVAQEKSYKSRIITSGIKSSNTYYTEISDSSSVVALQMCDKNILSHILLVIKLTI
jgi:hypothetical protein